MDRLRKNTNLNNRLSITWTLLLAGSLLIGVGILLAPDLYAALISFLYPPDKSILFTRSIEPVDFYLGNSYTITVTMSITNNESVDLRGFYYSDQAPTGWAVSTLDVSVNGSLIADYSYEQGAEDEIYTTFTPRRWALEIPQGGGAFSPTHPILASGGTAQIVYAMIVSGGISSDYSIGQDVWAGWLATVPTGTAVFGYQIITSTVTADLGATPTSGPQPLTVDFANLSTGEYDTCAWAFGDGGGSGECNDPSYTYDLAGAYTVTLTVSGLGGSDTESRQRHMSVWQQVIHLPLILRHD